MTVNEILAIPGQAAYAVCRSNDFIPPRCGDNVKVRPIHEFAAYRQREVKKFAGKVGKVVRVDEAYQDPDIYTVKFDNGTFWFFEDEVESQPERKAT